jgi:hypothetical protein
VFALSGTEIIEGALVEDRMAELRRVDLTGPAQQPFATLERGRISTKASGP